MNWRILWSYAITLINAPLQVINIPKLSEEDTTLTVANANGEKLTIPVPKGTRVKINIPGLHYNRENPPYLADEFSIVFFLVARYWKDPHSFNPERFLGDWPKDAFLPFSTGECWQGRLYSMYRSVNHSIGPRSCLGRKWVAFMSLLWSPYWPNFSSQKVFRNWGNSDLDNAHF